MRKFWFIFILSFVSFWGASNAQSVKSITISQQIDFNTTKSTQQDKSDIKIAVDSAFYNKKTARDTIIASDTQNVFKSRNATKDLNNNDIVRIKINSDSIANNTKDIREFSGWNCHGTVSVILTIISILLAIFACFLAFRTLNYSKKTFESQKETERNTSNVPMEVQRGVLRDLPRHLYRNLVCTQAIYLLYLSEGMDNSGHEKERERYPSVGNLQKLQNLPDDIVLPIGYGGAEMKLYKKAHELKLLFRNYNIEVNVASEHLSRKGIGEKSLEFDFDNLFFKPFFLIKCAFNYETCMPLVDKGLLVPRTIVTILSEHFKKLSSPSNFNLLFNQDNIQPFIKYNILFKKATAEKDSILRSVDPLLNYGEKEAKTVVDGITFNEINHDAIIQREIIIAKLIGLEDDKEDKEKINKFFNGDNGHNPGILSISDDNDFTDFCVSMSYIKKTGNEDKIVKAYKNLIPYLEYLQKETWEFRELLKNILTIDAAIETDRIGMVEYGYSICMELPKIEEVKEEKESEEKGEETEIK